jgi:hypothetical protein
MGKGSKVLRIAFVGTDQSEKIECAVYLHHTYHFRKIRLHDAVDDFVRKIYYFGRWRKINWAQRNQIYDALYKLDNNIWVGYVEGKLNLTKLDVVIDDARYSSEVNRLRDLGFIIVRVTKPSKVVDFGKSLGAKLQKQDIADGSVLIQETYGKKEVYKVDYSLYNDSKAAREEGLDRILELEHFEIGG